MLRISVCKGLVELRVILQSSAALSVGSCPSASSPRSPRFLSSTTPRFSMSVPQTVRHLHLPKITPFSYATAIQRVLVRQQLQHKAIASSPIHPHPLPPSPAPTIFSFTPTPVYTTGRRELGTLSEDTIQTLEQPLSTDPRRTGRPRNAEIEALAPEVRETLRGGQITFHGPGQLVIYPIFDLRTVKNKKWRMGLTPKCYVNVLEQATINTLKRFGIEGFRTDNPGVWVSEDRKIAALGVHLRRNITNYGVGLNIRTDLRHFDRIVACGLEGKRTTSIEQEFCGGRTFSEWVKPSRLDDARVRAQYTTMMNRMESGIVSKIWAKEFVGLVWGDEAAYSQQIASEDIPISKFLDKERWLDVWKEVREGWEEQQPGGSDMDEGWKSIVNYATDSTQYSEWMKNYGRKVGRKLKRDSND